MISANRVTAALDVTRAYAGTLAHFLPSGIAGGFAVVSPSAQRRMADAYAALPDRDESDDTIRAFDAFAREIRDQADTMIRAGWSFTVTDSDPYADAAQLFADVERRHIAVLSTSVTGAHPFLSDDDNDLFRAVHDVMGHAATGRGFDRHGEEAAYRAHAAVFSPLARRALTTETRGQNAALIAGGAFAAQKLALLPAWTWDVDALTPTADEMPAAIGQALDMHRDARFSLTDA